MNPTIYGKNQMVNGLKRDPNCKLCRLHETAEHVCLLGRGPIPCKIMIIGEAPGKREDDVGKPFQGHAGFLLEDILNDLGVGRNEVYITNAVHCRPPENKTPTKAQIRNCKTWLDLEIEAVNPQFVLLLGNTPLQAITGEVGIKKKRGLAIEKDGRYYFPTYHPAYALRDVRQEPVLRSDIKTFFKMVEKGGPLEEEGTNYRIVDSYKKLEKMIKDIDSNSVVSFDCETSGLEPHRPGSWVTSLGVGTKKYQWCLPLQHRLSKLHDDFEKQAHFLSRLDRVMKKVTKVAHNGKFDTLWIAVHYGLWWYTDFDTMLAHYNLDENSRHDLDFLSQTNFEANNYNIPLTDKFGLTGELEPHCKYLALDIYYTRKLFYVFRKQLRQEKATERLFYNLTMPVSRLYTDVEYCGIYVCPKELENAYRYWTKKRERTKSRLNKLVPSKNVWRNRNKEMETGVNWGSPQQVAKVLFDQLGLESEIKTEKGKNSTSESALLRLKDKHQVPELILKYREADKNLSTFIKPWMEKAINNRLHPDFKIHGTVTGRPSAQDPNPQQTPRDPRIRSIVRAPEGWILVSADYSQIELRLAADDSGDSELLLCYQTGVDVHVRTVQHIMGIANPNGEQRKKGKAINFGYLYGMWWPRFQSYAFDNFGIKVTDKEAEETRRGFFRLYSGLDKWQRRKKRIAVLDGYVINKIGRKRRLKAAMKNNKDFDCKEAQRQAINSPIQSLASDINLSAAVEIHNTFARDKLKIVSTTHDEILMEIKDEYLDSLLPGVREIMENPKIVKELGCNLSVPLIAEIELGPWGDHENNKKVDP